MIHPIFSLRFLLVFVCLFAALARAVAFDYYVSPAGVDSSGRTGRNDTDQAWKTVSYAATRVAAPGDTLHILAGTFEESAIVRLKAGVNLQGAGQGLTILKPATAPSPLIPAQPDPLLPDYYPYDDRRATNGSVAQLIMMDQGGATLVNGNQTLSRFTIDGRTQVVNVGIESARRWNVTIRDITIFDCRTHAIRIYGNNPTAVFPAPLDSAQLLANMQVLDCTLRNSGRVNFINGAPQNFGYPTLSIWHALDSVIRGNLVDETITGSFNISGAFWKNMKIQDNTCIQAAFFAKGARAKGFGVEGFFVHDSEISGLRSNGAISLPYCKNTRVFGNFIHMPAGEGKTQGIEFGGEDGQIYDNYIDGASPGIGMWMETLRDTRVYQNVFRNCFPGLVASLGKTAWTSGPMSFDGLDIDNNTFDLCSDQGMWAAKGAIGIRVNNTTSGEFRNLRIRNNIITNSVRYTSSQPMYSIYLSGVNGHKDAATMAKLITPVVANNLSFNNANSVNATSDIEISGVVYPAGTMANYVNNNVLQNPRYAGEGTAYPVSLEPNPYYTLKQISPAVNTGMAVGIPFVDFAPDRGAYESPFITPSFTSPAVVTFVAGRAGQTFVVTAGGMPVPTFGASGLPAWASLHPSTGVISGTPGGTQVGASTAALVASNGLAPAATQSLVISVITPFVAWRLTYFTPEEAAAPEISGPTVSLAPDGLSNLVHFALGYGPRERVPSDALVFDGVAEVWALTYFRPSAMVGVSYVVEGSTDLVSWSTAGVTHERVLIDGDRETWRGSVAKGAVSQFLRLKVNLTP